MLDVQNGIFTCMSGARAGRAAKLEPARPSFSTWLLHLVSLGFLTGQNSNMWLVPPRVDALRHQSHRAACDLDSGVIEHHCSVGKKAVRASPDPRARDNNRA